jgi:hypothetical protein
LFEAYLPRFFEKATQIYKQELIAKQGWRNDAYKVVTVNQNKFGKPVKNSTRELLLRHPVFILEYDFYEYVKQRLYKQATILKN